MDFYCDWQCWGWEILGECRLSSVWRHVTWHSLVADVGPEEFGHWAACDALSLRQSCSFPNTGSQAHSHRHSWEWRHSSAMWASHCLLAKTRRYIPLLGPTSSSCGRLRPLAKAFFAQKIQKKSPKMEEVKNKISNNWNFVIVNRRLFHSYIIS